MSSLKNVPRRAHKERFQPDEAKELQLKKSSNTSVSTDKNMPDYMKRETAASHWELEAGKSRVNDLEKLYMNMALKKSYRKQNIVKMRLSSQPARYTSGDKRESSEEAKLLSFQVSGMGMMNGR
ncbi:hypothetical protein ACH5RR_007169 [Cinchona calisaya]|uniref:Uncharacterized protein n=1 Tax=Cinchona calisaya TaxID=153742 RepID=A0ABD3AR19_9GENT